MEELFRVSFQFKFNIVYRIILISVLQGKKVNYVNWSKCVDFLLELNQQWLGKIRFTSRRDTDTDTDTEPMVQILEYNDRRWNGFSFEKAGKENCSF